MGTFGRLVFCAVRTQIVGKTKFFDSLSLETTLSSEYGRKAAPCGGLSRILCNRKNAV